MTASVALRPASERNHISLWVSLSALAIAFVALAAWFVVAVSTGHHSPGITPAVHQGGGAGQYNQLCVPAPGTNYC
jgi:hypothetical protein